jgi:hypothetical protein
MGGCGVGGSFQKLWRQYPRRWQHNYRCENLKVGKMQPEFLSEKTRFPKRGRNQHFLTLEFKVFTALLMFAVEC